MNLVVTQSVTVALWNDLSLECFHPKFCMFAGKMLLLSCYEGYIGISKLSLYILSVCGFSITA